MIEEEIGWETPINGAGEHTGFNDGGIAQFQADALGSLGKEGPQNSHDSPYGDGPVHVSVRLVKIAAEEFPGLEQLKTIVDRCASGHDPKSDKKVAAFFAKARQKLAADAIDVLVFTDSNTTGLVGPCEPGKPFHTLLKTRGSNIKANSAALGSYGIGKMAPYANSDLRTIIASTAYRDESGAVRRLVQGKSVLTSYSDGENVRDANSYWGVRSGFMPADPDLHGAAIPSFITEPHAQGQIGTTIFIPFFNGGENWAAAFTAHYLTTYFLAVHEGRATADIDGTLINRETLDQVMSDPSLAAALEANEEASKKFSEARAFYLALVSPDPKHHVREEFGRLGYGTLDILAGEGFPSKISIMRGGMQITTEMEGLVRFAALPPFAGVFRFESSETNELLRAMEPPRHDAFKVGLLPEEQQRHARLGLKEAARRIRQVIEDQLRGEIKEEVNLDELSDRLGNNEDARSRSNASEVNPLGRISLRDKARRLAMQGSRKSFVTGVAEGTASEGVVPSPGHAGRKQVGSGDGDRSVNEDGRSVSAEPTSTEPGGAGVADGVSQRQATTIFKIGAPRGFRQSGGLWKITFATQPDTDCLLAFRPLGFAEASENLEIASVEGGEVSGRDGVRVRSSASGKVSILVKFKNANVGGVKVVPHAV